MYSRIRKITALIILASILFSISGCFNEESDFPDLVFSEENSQNVDSLSNSQNYYANTLHEITVALPLTDETVNYLMKLYYAKTNGMFPDDQSGYDISLEYLDAISTTWVVNTITTTGEGESYDAIVSMNSSNSVPDLFLTSDMIRLNDDGLIIPLENFLADNSFLSSSMYLGALEPLLVDESFLGLPFYSTVMMIAGNIDYTPEGGVPSFSMSPEELLEYVNSIPDGYDFVPVYNPDEFDSFLGNNFFDGYESSDTDARLTRSCGIWLMNSGEFNTWNAYYPDGLYFTMLPTDDVYATVYPVCISGSSSETEFAADFASFICFDRDARMLINRLETERGYFPSISSPAVWEILSSDSEFGSQAMLYEQFMSDAIYRLPEDS